MSERVLRALARLRYPLQGSRIEGGVPFSAELVPVDVEARKLRFRDFARDRVAALVQGRFEIRVDAGRQRPNRIPCRRPARWRVRRVRRYCSVTVSVDGRTLRGGMRSKRFGRGCGVLLRNAMLGYR